LRDYLALLEEIMELRTKSSWLGPFLLTISIAWSYVFLTAYPGEAFVKSRGGSLPGFDLACPELSAAEQVKTNATPPNWPGESNKRLVKRLEPVRVNVLQKHFPIIFLPGVAGTRFFKIINSPAVDGIRTDKEEIWPIPFSSPADLYLDINGVPLDKTAIPGDIIRSVLPKFHNQLKHYPIYGPFLESIQSREFEADGRTWSYKEGENLFVWGYDWRLDNTAHLVTLDKFVNGVRSKTNSKKVILIAHSMGGLISRAYAIKNPDKVEALISIGSPYAGSPKPFYALVMGYTFGNDLVSPSTMKELVQNAPSTYQLIPQYDFVIDSITDFKEIPNQDFYQKIKYKPDTRSMNQRLLEKARPFYDIVGTSFNPVALPSDVKHYAIIGVSVQTLEGFVMRQADPADVNYLDYNGQKVILDPHFGDGDGTVPFKSADIRGTTRTYFIHHGEGFYSSGAHGDLPNNRDVQHIVRSILIGYPFRNTGSPDPSKPLVDIEPEADFRLR
jgi:pimeloyl-ACP methyl ester carboxylesterase